MRVQTWAVVYKKSSVPLGRFKATEVRRCRSDENLRRRRCNFSCRPPIESIIYRQPIVGAASIKTISCGFPNQWPGVFYDLVEFQTIGVPTFKYAGTEHAAKSAPHFPGASYSEQ